MLSFFKKDNNDLTFEQGIIIDNYNMLVERFQKINLNLNLLNKEGVCAGLTLNYLFLVKEGGENDELKRLNEFYNYIEYVYSLTETRIEELVEQYQKKEIKNKKYSIYINS
jgi:hypothetical protein